MSCWRCCLCCCSCCWRTEKTPSPDDGSSLIHPEGRSSLSLDPEAHAFYVPRRHSSFNACTHVTVTGQPMGRCHSDSCSSSGDEDGPSPHGEHRGRCWSTVPASTATDMANLVAERCNAMRQSDSALGSRSVSSPEPETCLSSPRTPLLFDRPRLAEIRESEREEKGESSPPLTPTSDEVYGYLIFSTSYDEQEQTLSVFVDRAVDLPKKSHQPDQQCYSTFVRLSLTSSRKNFLLSRTIRNTLDPVYREKHVFHTNRTKWKSFWNNALRLSVYDCDRQGRHDAVGHALLALARISEGEEEHRLPLSPMGTPVRDLGQLLVGLFYSAVQSRLSVHVIKARHLRLDPDAHKRQLLSKGRGSKQELFDSFAKVTLMCGGQKVKTNRSHVVPNKADPLFNHKSDFVVPPTFLPESSVVVTVVVKGPVIGRNVILGRVTAGPYVLLSNGAQTHWGRMVHDGRSVVQWRNLYL